MKILPLVARVYTVGFLKCFDIAVFCFILNQSGPENVNKNNSIFTIVNLFFKALNVRF